MKTSSKISIFVIIAVALASCTPARKIVYNLNKYQPASASIQKTISIETFTDIRADFEENEIYLQAGSIQENVNDKKSCITAENQYKTPVSLQLADMFAQYLVKKQYFSDVSLNDEKAADYYLTANVKQFGGYQDFSTSASVGAAFGLIGALATANIKSEGKLFIELTDIAIHDKNGNIVAEIGDLRKETEGELPVDAYCHCIYNNLNQFLAEFNEELGELVFQEIEKLD